MASDIWLRTILIVRKETHCRHIGYSYRLTARVLLYAPSHRQDRTYHGLCYTSRGALAGTRNSSMGPLHEGSIRRPIAPWVNALTMEIWNKYCIYLKRFAPVQQCGPAIWKQILYLYKRDSHLFSSVDQRFENKYCIYIRDSHLFSSVDQRLERRSSCRPTCRVSSWL